MIVSNLLIRTYASRPFELGVIALASGVSPDDLSGTSVTFPAGKASCFSLDIGDKHGIR